MNLQPHHSSDTSTESAEALDWLALQFLLEELEETASAAFEERLIGDEAAAAALIRATRLLQTLGQIDSPAETKAELPAVPVGGSAPSPRFGRKRFGWKLPASIACITALGIAGVAYLNRPIPNRAAAPQQVAIRLPDESRDPARLLRLWTEHSASLVSVGPPIESGSLTDVVFDDALATRPDLEEPMIADDFTAALLPPDWLLAAVEIEADGDSELLPDVERN